MTSLPKIFAVLTTLIISGCSSTYSINTKPSGVIVFSGDVKLGETPILLQSESLTQQTGGGAIIRLEQQGYKPLWMWVPAKGRDYSININLAPLYLRATGSIASESNEISRSSLYRLSEKLLDIQSKLLLGGEVSSDEIQQIINANPTLGSAHFLDSILKLKSGSKEASAEKLKEALLFAPSETDILSLYNEIKGATNAQ